MDADDDTMLGELGALLARVDPVPDDVTLAARSAIAWRRIDAHLAELLEDSALEAELAGTRGSGSGWRALTFESPAGTTIEVEVVLDGADRTIIGQIVPAESVRIALRQGRRQVLGTTDDLGRFRFEKVPQGPVSLRIDQSTGPIETGWVTI